MRLIKFSVEYTRAHKYQAPYRVTDAQTRSPVTFPAGIFGFVTQMQDYNQDKTGISTVSPKLRRDVFSNAIRIRASLNPISTIFSMAISRCSLKPDPHTTYHNSAVEDHTCQWAQTIDGRINLARIAVLSRLALHDTMPTPSLTPASGNGNGPVEASAP